MRRFVFIISVLFLASCGEQKIQKDPVLRFKETNVTINLKEEHRIPFDALEIDPYDINLEIDDFIAYGARHEDNIRIEGTHVGETTATITYGDLKSECKITVNGLLDARFLATPVLAFGESPEFIKNNTSGTLYEGDGYVARHFDTNWAGLVSTWGDSIVNVNYIFKNGKLDYVYVMYGGMNYSVQRMSDVKSAFFAVLSERYRFVTTDKWERPGEYVVRMYVDHHRSSDFAVFLQYAKDFDTINNYGNPSN